MYNFSSRLTSVSALLCKTGNRKITPFHLNDVCWFANKHTKYIKIFTWSYTDYTSFIKRSTACTKHDQHRAQSIQPSDMHTVGVHHVCHDTGCHDSYGSSFGQHWKSTDTISEMVYYTISTNVNCYQIRHSWIFFCFQQDITLAHHACNTVKLQEHELSTSLLLIMAFNLKSSVVRAADYEIQRFTY